MRQGKDCCSKTPSQLRWHFRVTVDRSHKLRFFLVGLHYTGECNSRSLHEHRACGMHLSLGTLRDAFVSRCRWSSYSLRHARPCKAIVPRFYWKWTLLPPDFSRFPPNPCAIGPDTGSDTPGTCSGYSSKRSTNRRIYILCPVELFGDPLATGHGMLS